VIAGSAKSTGTQLRGGESAKEAYRVANRKKKTGQLATAGVATCDQKSFRGIVIEAFSKAAAKDQ
jgi:hypothetical protein